MGEARGLLPRARRVRVDRRGLPPRPHRRHLGPRRLQRPLAMHRHGSRGVQGPARPPSRLHRRRRPSARRRAPVPRPGLVPSRGAAPGEGEGRRDARARDRVLHRLARRETLSAYVRPLGARHRRRGDRAGLLGPEGGRQGPRPRSHGFEAPGVPEHADLGGAEACTPGGGELRGHARGHPGRRGPGPSRRLRERPVPRRGAHAPGGPFAPRHRFHVALQGVHPQDRPYPRHHAPDDGAVPGVHLLAEPGETLRGHEALLPRDVRGGEAARGGGAVGADRGLLGRARLQPYLRRIIRPPDPPRPEVL